MDLIDLFALVKKIFGIIFCAFPLVSLLMWVTPQNMKNKNRIFLILASLLLFALVVMPSKVNMSKIPGADRIKDRIGGGGGQAGGDLDGYGGVDVKYGSTSRNGGERIIDGVTTGIRKGKDGVINYVDERMNSQQVIPARHDDIDRWGYDNKYYRQIDRGYNINIMDDIRLEQRNVRGLLGRSVADITFYNKGLFNSGYGDLELLVISYDKYGNYLGERIDVLNGDCICKSQKYRQKLQISRDTDEIIVKVLKVNPCECLDWNKKAERERTRARKEYDRVQDKTLKKQYREWEAEQARQRDEMDRLMKKDRREAEKEAERLKREYERYAKQNDRKNKDRGSKKDRKNKNKGDRGNNNGGNSGGGNGSNEYYVHDHDGIGPHTHYYQSADDYNQGDHAHQGNGGQYNDHNHQNGNGQSGGQNYQDQISNQYPDYDEFMKNRTRGIPDNIEYTERRPNHVESYCDCRQCRYKRGKGIDYQFNYKE